MIRISALMIGLCCFGVVFGSITAAHAQSETPPAGSSLALTPPIDRRAKQYGGYKRPHRAAVHRRHRMH